MAAEQSDALLRHIRKLMGAQKNTLLSDAELLERFITEQDEPAFASLVRRHGAMVLGVCRAVLRHQQDAEDVFQATFLVLARKAASVRRPESLASWLHGTARRLALKLRARTANRPAHQASNLELLQAPAMDDLSLRELRVVLHEELDRLPERFRSPLVLCHLEGKTQAEAAQQLGWTGGMLRGRLLRGRDLLRSRLTRRGSALSLPLFTAVLSEQESAAALPSGLADATVKCVVLSLTGQAGTIISAQASALAKEALATMVFTKGKIGTALLLFLSLLTAGTGWALQRARQPKRQEPEKALVANGEPGHKQVDPEERSALSRPHTDFFGDPLPNQAIARLGTVRFRHNGSIYAIAFSPDGQLIASAASHGQVRIWNAATGQRVQSLDDPSGSVKQCVAFSPDGKLLATDKGYTDKEYAAIWNVATGKILCCLDRKCPGTVYSMDFAPDGRSLVLASNSNDAKAIWFFDSATGQVMRRLEGHGQTVCAAVFSKDGKRLASASKDRTARLWDLTNDKVLREFPHGEEVVDVALSPDGKHLASKTIKAVYLWDLDSGKTLHRFDRQSAPMRSLAFSPDGEVLASEGILWEVATGKKRCECENNTGYSTAFSPDGKVVATGGFNGIVSQYDPVTGKELPQSLRGWNRGPLSAVAFSPDGNAVMTRGNDGISMWNATTWQPVYRLPRAEAKLAVAISPDSKTLATLGVSGTIELWDAATGQALRRMQGKVDDRNVGLSPALLFSPDSKTLASAGYSSTIHLWSASTGQEIQQLAGHERGIYALAFAPDGKSLLSASLDHTRRDWDLVAGKERRKQNLEGWIRGISPDGRWYAKSLDSALSICDLRTGKELRKLEGVGCNWCAFSPDGKTVAVDAAQGGSPESEQWIHLLEIATCKVRRTFTGHCGFLLAAGFSPDGTKLVSASFDTTCLIWDVTGGQPSVSQRKSKELWDASSDATRAYQAIWALSGAAKLALPLFRDHLRPVPQVDDRQIARWIADLDSAHFQVRQKAPASLEALGELAEPALRASLGQQPSAELRQRVEELLRRIEGPIASPEKLQALRAIEVLEHIGTPETRHLLEALVKGAPEARLTQEARASLERLDKRHGGGPITAP